MLARYCKNEQDQCLARLSKIEQDFLARFRKIMISQDWARFSNNYSRYQIYQTIDLSNHDLAKSNSILILQNKILLNLAQSFKSWSWTILLNLAQSCEILILDNLAKSCSILLNLAKLWSWTILLNLAKSCQEILLYLAKSWSWTILLNLAKSCQEILLYLA